MADYDAQTGSNAADNGPIARPDVDTLPSGSFGPASGNAITGAGTDTGSSGADSPGSTIVEVHGAGGASSGNAGNFQANGQYGVLSMDAEGNFNYVRNAGTPDGVRDVFGYTIASAQGANASSTLTIDIATGAQATALNQGIVNLPAGVELSDIHVNGRDLVIDMPDGTHMVIPGGAVFVPQLVIGDVAVPPSNVAALLIDSEPQPAAGNTPSSGGNFADPVPPLDPGVSLGDLIPPTELTYTPPEFEDIGQFEDTEPTVIIITPDNPAGAINAIDHVDESGLPARGSEPPGTLEPQNIESTSGTIQFTAQDGLQSITIDGVQINAGSVGSTIPGEHGTLTITSVNLAAGTVGYSYTATDNTTDGVNDFEDFTVIVTDSDGDAATGTLHINIEDDEPIALDDTDSITEENTVATGNVMTGVGTTSGAAGHDTVGADDASLTAVSGAHGSDSTFDSAGHLVVQGQYGTLTIDAEGNYTYNLTSELPEAAAQDVFTYTLTDGDGDTDTATLTINVPGNPNDIPEILSADSTLVDEDGLRGANVDAGRPGEVDSTESTTDTGQIVVNYKGDVPANVLGAITLVDSDGLDTQLTTPDGTPIHFTLEGGDLIGRPVGSTDAVIIISIDSATAPTAGGQVTYTYSVELLGPVAQPDPGSEDSVFLHNVGVQVTDSNGDHASATVDVEIVDDLPIAVTPPDNPQDPEGPPLPIVSGAVDEDDLPDGNNDVADGDNLPIDSSTTVGGPAGSLAALFSAGADSPMTNFGLVDDTSGLPALHSNGHDVLYDINTTTGVLTAYADLDNNGLIDDGADSAVFTLTVGEDGSWSFELLGQLDHPIAGTEDNLLLDFSSVVTAEDQDGDPATAAPGAFVINVDDDMPQPFDHENCPTVTAVNGPGDVSDPLSLNLPDIGADQPAKLTFGYVDGEGHVVLVADGDPVTDTGDHQLTSDGSLLHYEVIDADTLQAVNADGDPVFEINLNSDGTFTYQQFLAIDNGSGSVSFDNLTGTNAGNSQFQGVGADDPVTQVDLLISAEKDGASATVNTDSDSIGSANQSMDDGETVRIDFVKNLTVDGGDSDTPPSGFNYGAHVGTNTFTGEIPQVQGEQGETVAFTVWALDTDNTDAVEPDRNPDGGFDDADSVHVTDVTVKDYLTGESTTIPVASFEGDGLFHDVAYGVSVMVNADGSVTFSGIQEGDSYGIATGANSFNAVAVQAEPAGTGPGDGSTQDSFDLGTFAIGSVDSGEPVNIAVPILVTDADGDPTSCDIDITLNPGTSVANAAGTVNEAALDDVGSNPGSTAETVTIDLADSVGGTGPFTFALVGDTDHDGVVEGNFGTFTLQPDGHTVVYTLNDPVDDGEGPSDGTNPVTGLENLGFTVTGPDGDTDSTIQITIIDDVPTARNDIDVINEGDASEDGNVITGVGTTTAGDTGDDTQGADGAAVSAASGFGGDGIVDVGTGNITVEGQWGTLVIEPNGHYTYTLSAAGTIALNALGDNQTLTAEVFNYTLTDGDGDQSSATLTITPTGANDNPGLIVPDTGDDTKTVFEAGLASAGVRAGEPAGTAEAADGNSTDNDVNSETTTGTFTFSDGDGASTITIQGSGVSATPIPLAGPFPIQIAGDYGTLTITGISGHTVSYSYTLADNISHNDANPNQDDFTITVDDSDGSSADAATDTLTIHIADDTPIANNDTDVIDEGDTSEIGNVITGVGTTNVSDSGDDFVGADNSTVTAATGFGGAGIVDGGTGNITVTGQWGTIVIEPDGDYTYTLSSAGTAALNALGAGQTLTAEVVTYTLTDSDGSFDTATLTITPTGANDNPGLIVPDTGADTKTVDEAGLASAGVRAGEPAGTAEAADGNSTDNDVNSETTTGTFTFSDGDGASTITIQGSGVSATPIPLAGPFPIQIAGDYGTLTITGISGHTVSYSYTLADNISHNDANPNQDDFTITVDDSDGSSADAVSDTLTIHIADDTPIANNDTDALVEGQTGQSGNVITGVGTTNVSDSGDDFVGADNSTVTAATGFGGAGVVDGGTGNITVTGQWGTIVIEPDGDYTYTLSTAGLAALEAKGAGQTLTPETVTYTLTDSDGSFDTATLTISLTGTDDTPTLTVPDTGPDLKTVDEAGLPTRTGELAGTGEAADSTPNNDNSEIVSGTFSFTGGDGASVVTIDGAGAGGPLTIPLGGPFPTAAIVGAHGSLVVTAVSGGTVSYTYTLSDNADHSGGAVQDDFTITVDDSDGSTADKVTDTLTIHITDDAPLNFQPDAAIAENTGTDVVSGSLDDDGTLANDGGADSIASLVWNTGTNGTILLDTDGHHVTVGGLDVKLYIQPDGSLVATTDINSAAATVFTATLDAATSSYNIDFDRPLDNGSTTASDFSSLAAGNTPWKGLDTSLNTDGTHPGIGDAEVGAANDSTDLLFTGYSGTVSPGSSLITINTDSDDIGTGGGQKINPNEYLRIDMVQDLRQDGGGVDESDAGGYHYDTHVGQTHFQFGIVESQAHGEVDVLIKAFNVDDDPSLASTPQTNVDAVGINHQVALDPLSIEVTVNGVAVDPNTYEVILSSDGKSVYVQGVPEHALISFQAVGGASFEAVTIENANGDQIPGEDPGTVFTGTNFGAGAFTFGQNDPGDPVEFNLPVLLTDGDGDTSSGTVPVTVYPVGQVPDSALSTLSFQSTALESKTLDTSSLFSANDNGHQDQRFASNGTNAGLLGAVAAAGLSSAHELAGEGLHGSSHGSSSGPVTVAGSTLTAQFAAHDEGGQQAVAAQDNAPAAADHQVASAHSAPPVNAGDAPSLAGQDAAPQSEASPLSAGTESSHADVHAFTAAAVSIPSAQALAAAGDGVAAADAHVQSNEVVSKVLADSLAGGQSNGPNLDALLQNAAAEHGPANAHGGLANLATQAADAVSIVNSVHLAGFTLGHNAPMMEHMVMHQDAVPAHS